MGGRQADGQAGQERAGLLSAVVVGLATQWLRFGWLALPLAAALILLLRLQRHRWLWTGLEVPLGLLLLGSLIGLWPSVDLSVSLERLWGVSLGALLCLGLAWLHTS